MKIQKSSEDYLETMLILKETLGYIRSIDIARHLGVTKPSVSYATKNLRENGYISMDKEGLITLTEFLIRLGVDPAVAEEDACKIEHDLSEESFAAICRHALAEKAEQ